MKAFILAAGYGTRLRPLTDHVPKCLVPIRGVPMLQIWLDLCAMYGIDEVLINVHSHADHVRAFLAANTGTPVRVSISEEAQLLGSAGTLRANQAWVERETSFWVLYGDVLTGARFDEMLDVHQKHGLAATLAVSPVGDPKRCGIVSVDDRGVITDFVEKPVQPRSNLAFSGLMVCSPAIFHAIPEEVPADIGYNVLPRLVGNMAAYRVHDYLIDIGTMENYNEAQQNWPGLKRPLQ